MKRLLLLLAILMASLPSWAAEEEIHWNFKQTGKMTVSLKRNNIETSNAYGMSLRGYVQLKSSNQTYSTYDLTATTNPVYPVVEYVDITDPNTKEKVLRITVTPSWKYISGFMIWSRGTNTTAYGPGGFALRLYKNPTSSCVFEHKITTYDGLPISQLKLGDGNMVTANTTTFAANRIDENQQHKDITTSVTGKWKFEDNCLIFTPDNPTTELTLSVVSGVTTHISFGYFGVVRNVKAPAPELTDEIKNSTSFPTIVNGEYHYLDGMPYISVKGAKGEKYVYSINNSLTEDGLTATSSEMFGTEIDGVYQFSAMIMDNIPVGESKVLHCAQVEDDGNVGEVLHLPICHVAIPTVTYPEGAFEYMAEKGEITIEKPTGVDEVYYSFLDDDPTSAKGTLLPADGKITLPAQEVGSSLKLNLVAKCGDSFGETTTVKCKRVALAKLVVVGYTEDFTLTIGGELYNEKYYLNNFNESVLKKDLTNGVILKGNYALFKFTNKYTLNYDGETGPFIEAQISSSDSPNLNDSWHTLYIPIEEYPEFIVFDEGDNPPLSTLNFKVDLGADPETFFFNDRKECYLHLRAATNARNFDGSLPAGTSTSEVTTLHIVKAKPAKPGMLAVAGYTVGKALEVEGNEVALELEGLGEGALVQYQLTGSALPDANGVWKSYTITSGDNAEEKIFALGEVFPAEGDKRPAEIYLHLRAVTAENPDDYDFVAGDATTVHLTHARPAEPWVNLDGFPHDTKGTLTRLINSADVSLVATTGDNQKVQYCFAEYDGNVWPGPEPAAADWKDATQAITVAKDGRLYARVYDTEYDQASYTYVMDFEITPTEQMSAEGWTATEANTLVQINEPMKVMGSYMTHTAGSDATAFVYLIDGQGNTLKMVIKGQEEALREALANRRLDAFAEEGHDGQDLVIAAGNIIGRLQKRISADGHGRMPELEITPSASESYLEYLQAAEWTTEFVKTADYAARQEQVRTEIDPLEDFARLVSLRSLTWLGANRVRTANGVEMTLYGHLDIPKATFDPEKLESLAEGRLYSISGYIGQLDGELALFPVSNPLACPGTPVLYAPNLIDGEPENGFIPAKAISDEVEFTVESPADADDVTFLFKAAASPELLDQARPDDKDVTVANKKGTFKLTLEKGKTTYLAVYARVNGMESLQPAKVAITHTTAQEVSSIAEFKNLEQQRREEPGFDGSEKIYRLAGQAVIRKITPYYLYVSDPATADNASTAASQKCLLIYNGNGWTNPQFNDGTTVRGLEAGDIIENFAIVGHDGIKLLGNIISNSTDYARTFKYAGKATDQDEFKPEVIDVNYVDAASDSHYSKVAFGEELRITYVELRNVRVKRTGDATDGYAYTLDIKDEPALTFAVFPNTLGWNTMWKEGEGFTISGVVVRDDKADGTIGYAFAPTAFEAANSLTGELSISFDGEGEVVDGIQRFVSGKAVIEYAPAQDETVSPTIYYTTDGTDPRNNVGGRTSVSASRAEIELTDDVVIRAFAAAPGLNPTAESSMTLRNAVSNVQYILNFLRAGREGLTYRFTSRLQIVAAGGNYLFVAGPVGHFLPVYNEQGWDETVYARGRYVESLLARKSADDKGNVIADATGHQTAVTDEAGEQITVTPDEVSALTAASARRLVTVRNVTVKAAAAAREVSARLTITTVDGAGSHPLMAGNLGDVTIKKTDAQGQLVDTDLEFTDGEAYDITGFVMLGEAAEGSDEPAVELWPVTATHLERTPAVSINVQDALSQTMTAENEYTARFTRLAGVSISAANVRGVRIYYSFDNEEWFEYFRPIAVEEACMIHAKAVAPGMVESVHTHLTLEKAAISGEVKFATAAAEKGGKVTVTIAPAADLQQSSYAIYYTTDGTTPTAKEELLYKAPFDLTENGIVKAILVENGCEPGTVGTAHVNVPAAQPEQPEQPEQPDPTVSGRVKFSLDDSDPAKVLVKIEPDGTAAPGYEIYYTTEAGKAYPDGWIRYDKPFDVTESTLVMAVLVENGKKPGAVAEVSVWVNPGVTGIDGIGADEATETVRVDGNTIVAPAGSRVYDISGRQVRPEGLRQGVYIVVTPDGKSAKVMVK